MSSSNPLPTSDDGWNMVESMKAEAFIQQVVAAHNKLEQENHALRASNLELQKDLAYISENNHNLRDVLEAKTMDFHRRTIGDALAGVLVGAFVVLIIWMFIH